MEDLLNRLRAVNESDDRYSKKVATDIVIDGAEVTNISEVTIQYDFELEQKSWGFNGVIFAAAGPVEIEAEVDGKLTTFQVDLSNADILWVPGRAFYPSQLTVYAGRDGKVNKVEINVEYWEP